MPGAREGVPALWLGNALWLDFVNTRHVEREVPRDALATFPALVAWLAEAGVLREDQACTYAGRWEGTPVAADVLHEAQVLRDALRDLADALATAAPDAVPHDAGERGARRAEHAVAAGVAAVNRVLRAHVSHPELTRAPAGDGPAAGPAGSAPAAPFRYVRAVRPTDDYPLRALAPVADAAADVLCGAADRALVRRCGNPKCVLYFYDTTKNRHRRFCSAAGCGNRVKAAARYARVRAARAGAPPHTRPNTA
jgi:predicted RNA-binding Zn ribbon-like protein